MSHSAALERLLSLPRVELGHYPTPVEELPRFAASMGPGAPRILVKRDDAISFAFGGNKVRKLELVLAEAVSEGADTLVTVGGVNSNHVRVTASAAARLGLGCVLIINGSRPERPSGNALLDELSGATIYYVGSRDERNPRMRAAVADLQRAGRKPYAVPLGASTPLGAIGYARAVLELVAAGHRPDAIVVASSSGGTLAGIIAGTALCGLEMEIHAISPDDPAREITATATGIVRGMGTLLGVDAGQVLSAVRFHVDDGFVGEGYGIPTPGSREAIALAARTEALYLDPTYTAKAMAALIAYVRAGKFRGDQTVLFWHTGGQVQLVA